MKRFLAVFILGMSFAATGALAQGKGGFTETTPRQQGQVSPSQNIVTVAQAKGMADDQKVILQGYIIQHQHGEKYLFKDDTGTITLDIDNDEWNGQTISPQDKVEIHGEIDQDKSGLEIDVDRIRKL